MNYNNEMGTKGNILALLRYVKELEARLAKLEKPELKPKTTKSTD